MGIFDNLKAGAKDEAPAVPKKAETKKPKKPEPKKKSSAKKPVEKKAGKKKPEEKAKAFTDKAMEKLYQESTEAKLKQPILKNVEQEYKNEKKKLDLMKEAGDVIEYSMADFLFLGYMEKCNLHLLGFMKKNRPKIKNLIKEGDTAGVEKLVLKEIKSILISIKKEQAEDLKQWKREMK